MEPMFWIFLGIVGAFFLFLIAREFVGKRKEKICAICFAFSLVWIVLLSMLWLEKFDDKVLLALMMGLTILGIFYAWERNVREKLLIFRLPLLLTLVLVGYTLIEGFIYGYNVLIFLGLLWVLFGVIYLYGSQGKAGGLVRKLVECCKKW